MTVLPDLSSARNRHELRGILPRACILKLLQYLVCKGCCDRFPLTDLADAQTRLPHQCADNPHRIIAFSGDKHF